MSRTKKITYDITTGITNLRKGDRVVSISGEVFFTVAYIDLAELNAVLVRNNSKGFFVMNLTDCKEFLIF